MRGQKRGQKQKGMRVSVTRPARASMLAVSSLLLPLFAAPHPDSLPGRRHAVVVVHKQAAGDEQVAVGGRALVAHPMRDVTGKEAPLVAAAVL